MQLVLVNVQILVEEYSLFTNEQYIDILRKNVDRLIKRIQFLEDRVDLLDGKGFLRGQLRPKYILDKE